MTISRAVYTDEYDLALDLAQQPRVLLGVLGHLTEIAHAGPDGQRIAARIPVGGLGPAAAPIPGFLRRLADEIEAAAVIRADGQAVEEADPVLTEGDFAHFDRLTGEALDTVDTLRREGL
ncbi:hypothetical protein RGUI_2741 [Rhodovulum sp. P5]|uniref:hypothetical protein n=1 Tax=Rhodovulum sp. P5 TaxID=1564506 RepID=UPI0009C29EE0|nr:hypothetical protein [Rhodovulum sp. P5]ARE40882.1 hypothetical protein RGUI_2741 [Rhodovulum sp. P5]